MVVCADQGAGHAYSAGVGGKCQCLSQGGTAYAATAILAVNIDAYPSGAVSLVVVAQVYGADGACRSTVGVCLNHHAQVAVGGQVAAISVYIAP